MNSPLPASTLLVFAHRGEAQVFVREFGLQKLADVNLPFEVLSDSSQNFLLVCMGEGLQNATECVSATLAIFGQRITTVVNLGIAGILSPDLDVGKTIHIRTCYAQKNSKDMEFKSFSTDTLSASHDIVSARDRVLTTLVAEHLGCFAPIVDREAWAVASVAHRFGKSFHCIKYLSDRAGEDEICQVAKDLSLNFSQQLFHSFQEWRGNLQTPLAEVLAMPEGFYFTKAQSDMFISVSQRLALKWGLGLKGVWPKLAGEGLVIDLLASPILPKKRTHQILKFMTALLNPFYADLEKKISAYVAPLMQSGIKIEFDDDMKESKLSTVVRSPEEFQKATRALQSFDYQGLQDILEGRSE